MGHRANCFKLLLWKNYRTHFCHPIQAAIEILSPVLFAFLLVLLRSLVLPERISSDTYYESFNIHSFVNDPSVEPQAYLQNLAFSPSNNKKIQEIMNLTQYALNLMQVTEVQDAEALADFLTTSENVPVYVCGVQFPDNLKNKDDIDDQIKIVLRFPPDMRYDQSVRFTSSWKTDKVFPSYEPPGPRSPLDITGGDPLYYEEGFLPVQVIVSYAIIALNSNKTMEELPEMYMQRFPYPPFIHDPLLRVLESFAAMIILLSFTYPCLSVVRVIATEKEKQLKDYMIIMGLPNWMFWSSWFITCVSFHMISASIFLVLMKVAWVPGYPENSVFEKSSFVALWIFMLIYVIAVVTFSFMVTTWFNKVNTASLVALLVWYIFFLPFLYLKRAEHTLKLGQKLLQCLLFNSAMAYGFSLVIKLEGQGEGLTFGNYGKSTFSEKELTMGYICMMLIIDSIIHMLLALYIENVFPGGSGIPLKWYYLCQKSYWVKNKEQHEYDPDEYKVLRGDRPEMFEAEEPNAEVAVQVIHLRKQYSKKAVAIHDLTLNFYYNKIVALLGHNGAGKTTMMSILIGRIPPTSGTAILDGYDIRTQIHYIRKIIGVCPQHNVLYDDLTVFEHLYFYCRIKDFDKDNIDDECLKYIQALGLNDKAGSRANTLSGGMQRKLSIAIALCGQSKIVMLDEPTAGIDPTARRTIWEVLVKEKQGRAMLISTHFMDEAEYLGDQIAIMARGKLQCMGSSYFLKRACGLGYTLIIEIKDSSKMVHITDLLRLYIPELKITRRMGSEITYKLPKERQPIFPMMLHDLEIQQRVLSIRSFGIQYATMEEVFMEIGTFDEVDEGQNLYEFDETAEEFRERDPMAAPVKTGWKLHFSRLKALVVKKIVVTYRHYLHLIMQCVIPVLFVIIAIAIYHSWIALTDLPEFEYSLDIYNDPVAVVGIDKPDDDEVHSDTLRAYYESYIQLLKDNNVEYRDCKEDNITTKILEQTREDEFNVRLKWIIGARFVDNNTVLAMYNNQPYHSRPAAVQYLVNSIYHEEMGDSNYDITFTLQPLQYKITEAKVSATSPNNLSLHLAFNLGFGMSVLAAFFIIFYISERVCRSKRIQFISGANFFTFWGSAFIMDFLIYLLPCTCLIITLACFQEDGYSSMADLSRVMILLVIFGFVMLPLNYCTSFFCNIPTTGYAIMVVLHLITGPTMFLIIEILSTPVLGIEDEAKILHYCFLVFPVYFFIAAMNDMYRVYKTIENCNENCDKTMPDLSYDECWDTICSYQNLCCEKGVDYFDLERPGIGWHCLISGMTGVALFLLLVLLEFRVFQKMCQFEGNNPRPKDDDEEDYDVYAEKRRIRAYRKKDTIHFCLVIQDVSKYYKNFLAVKNISFELPHSQCFGLLGLNGAGKSSMFKIMNGEQKMSHGDGFVSGISMKESMPKILPIIGYCPQFDALLEELTPRETITIYCWLRGISSENTKRITKYLAVQFDFERYLDRPIEHCSGGNKRKVSIALCLIGNPVVLLLDEPTTGIDAAAKRRIWTALWKIRQHGRSIILTSHSMEECEALCTRLAIMVNGQFKCIGSSQHLKSKYSNAYTLMIKPRYFNDENEYAAWKIDVIARFLTEQFGSVSFKEQFDKLLKYRISNSRLPLSMMFEKMEQHKVRLQIVDYSLGQITLEEIFFTFTKYQREEK